jgi:hypothetical protein
MVHLTVGDLGFSGADELGGGGSVTDVGEVRAAKRGAKGLRARTTKESVRAASPGRDLPRPARRGASAVVLKGL